MNFGLPANEVLLFKYLQTVFRHWYKSRHNRS